MHEMMTWKKAFGEKMQKNITNNLVNKMQNSTSNFGKTDVFLNSIKGTLIINIHC